MGRVDVGRVLTAIGAVSEATTTDELLDAALACAVVVAGADSGVITLTGPAVPLVRWWPDDFLADAGQDFERHNQATFSVPVDGARGLCIAVDRKGSDFSVADLERIDALRRPLAANAARVAGLERAGPARHVVQDAGLTPREAAVLALVASGLANDQAARRLGISARTVNKHLEHIFLKFGVSNRTEAAARWHRGPGEPAPRSADAAVRGGP